MGRLIDIEEDDNLERFEDEVDEDVDFSALIELANDEGENGEIDELALKSELRLKRDIFLAKFKDCADLASSVRYFFVNDLKIVLSEDQLSRMTKHIGLLLAVSGKIGEVNEMKIGGRELFELQKEAALGFYEWLRSKMFEGLLLGHIVMPTASGKTNTAVLLSSLVQGKTVYIAYSTATAEQAVHSFVDHFGEDKVGSLFSKQRNGERQHTVTSFSVVHHWDRIDWHDVDVIFVDEADVSSLSTNRREIIRGIAEKNSIPVIGMSATEQQASGKRLLDVYPDEILHLPMPDSLGRCLELNMIPDLEFSDLYVDSTLSLDASEYLTGDLQDDLVADFINSNAWNEAILDNYVQNYRQENGDFVPGIVVYRNNLLADDFIEQARRCGVRAARYTGDEQEKELQRIREDYNRGEIDLLIGSKLLGRGLDIPRICVVFNSTLTYSPQVFWQADGRGFRKDPENPFKKAKIVAVLPSELIDKSTGRVLLPEEKPLCHATFFNPDYFKRAYDYKQEYHGFREKSNVAKCHMQMTKFDLSKVGVITSIEEVQATITRYRRKPFGFMGKASSIADIMNNMREEVLSFRSILYLSHSFSKIKAVQSSLNDMNSVYDPEIEIGYGVKNEYRSSNDDLTLAEEKAYLAEYASVKNDPSPELIKRKNELELIFIKAYLPFVRALSGYYLRLANLDESYVDDLVQVGCIELMFALNNHDSSRGHRILLYLLWRLRSSYDRFVNDQCMIKMPQRMNALYETIMNILHESPGISIDEIVEKLNIRKTFVYSALRFGGKDIFCSLDEDMEPDDLDLEFFMNGFDGPEKYVASVQMSKLLDDLFAYFPDKIVDVVSRRYGLGEYEEHTLTAIGDCYGVTLPPIQKRLDKFYQNAKRVPTDEIRGLLSLDRDKFVPMEKERPIYRIKDNL